MLARTELLEDSIDHSRRLDDELNVRAKVDEDEDTSDCVVGLLVDRDDEENELIVLRELLLLDDREDPEELEGLLCVLVFSSELLEELELRVEVESELLEEVS